MILSQAIIFVLGWPLEWTEIIVIFVPIFLPLLSIRHRPVLLGAGVRQPAGRVPVSAGGDVGVYLKGVSPKHVTLNQIFAGMMPYMGIQVVAIILLYMFPGIGLWLPAVLYK